MKTLILALGLFLSTASFAAQPEIKQVPLIMSYAERAVLVMSVSSDNTYWFSECRLPVVGQFVSTEQLASYLNSQGVNCRALSHAIFQVGNEAQIKQIQTQFNDLVSKRFESVKDSAFLLASLNTFSTVLGALNVVLGAVRNSSFTVVGWTVFTYIFGRDLISDWTRYVDTQDVTAPTMESLAGPNSGSNVNGTLYGLYREVLIQVSLGGL